MMRALLLLCFFVLVGCASSVALVNTAPPKSGEPKVHRVAVLKFTDDKGDYFTNTLASVLPKLSYQGKQVYTVLDRTTIENIISEQEFQMTIADPDTMIEFGMLAGIEGGFSGGVLYDTRTVQVQEERTAYKDNKSRTYYVYCTESTYSMGVTMKLTDYSTTQVIYSGAYSRSMQQTRCPDGSRNSQAGGTAGRAISGFGYQEYDSEAVKGLQSSSDPYIIMANKILADVAKDLGEYKIRMNIDVADNDKTLSKADQKKFKYAVDLASDGEMQTACDAWDKLGNKYQDAPYLAYNMGICAEFAGDYDGALAFYTKASENLTKADSKVTTALKRIRSKIEQGIR